jgi:anti-anti-sigma factor
MRESRHRQEAIPMAAPSHPVRDNIKPLNHFLRPTGELDLATAPTVFATRNLRPGAHVTVDLGHATFLDAAALGAIVKLSNTLTATGGTLRLTGLTPRHSRLLVIGGLAALL